VPALGRRGSARGHASPAGKGCGRIFLLTRVTRIFEERVFAEIALARVAARAFCCMRQRRHAPRTLRGPAGSVAAPAQAGPTSGCRKRSPAQRPCFRPVLYREPRKLNVYPPHHSAALRCADGNLPPMFGAGSGLKPTAAYGRG
jgi:hypothetical protein